ncbi:MAG: hypothetical protein EBS19_05820 [Spirochaetia bacterium]|nr:hypothetical protein [Spirochaetia bacterium]
MSKYLTLAKEGLVPSMDCPLDQGLLFANMDINDEIFIYCISCNYKKYIGIKIYKNMEKVLYGKN